MGFIAVLVSSKQSYLKDWASVFSFGRYHLVTGVRPSLRCGSNYSRSISCSQWSRNRGHNYTQRENIWTTTNDPAWNGLYLQENFLTIKWKSADQKASLCCSYYRQISFSIQISMDKSFCQDSCGTVWKLW